MRISKQQNEPCDFYKGTMAPVRISRNKMERSPIQSKLIVMQIMRQMTIENRFLDIHSLLQGPPSVGKRRRRQQLLNPQSNQNMQEWLLQQRRLSTRI